MSILANNYGAAIDPITGQLLEQNPTLAATPTGDTNGDGVVDAADLNTVLSNLGNQLDPNHVPIDESLTEAEALAVEAGFRQAVPMRAECFPCYGCPPERCLRRVNPFEELEGDPPDFDDGGDGTGPPDDDDGPGGGGGPDGPDSDGDDDGDGILNKDDCDSAAFAGGGGGGNCSDPCGDSDGDGKKNQDDCDSECHQNASTRAEVCECAVTIDGCPTLDGRPVNGVSPTEVIILPDDPAQSATVTLTATGDPGGGTYQWFVVGAVADNLDQPTITLTVTNPGEVVASVTYTTQGPSGQPCTARDRCEFLAWRCVIEPTETVVCLRDPPEPKALTIDPMNAPEAEIRWTVVQGSDHVTTVGGSGTTFEITPLDPGDVVVNCELRRNGAVKCDWEVTLTIPGPVCGAATTIVPAFNPTVTPSAGNCGGEGVFGRTSYDPLNVSAIACYDKQGAQWTLCIDSMQQDIAVCVSPGGSVDVSSAMSSVVTAQTYCAILVDITPTPLFQGGPRQQYTSIRCTEEHEMQHVQEWKDTFNPIWITREAAWESAAVACSTNLDTPEKALADLKATSRFDQLVAQLYEDIAAARPTHANGRTTTYQVHEACHAPIRDAIRQRAQAEGWAPCPN